MINFPVASIEGFGEADEIALERDHAYEQIQENKAQKQIAKYVAISEAQEYGTSSDAMPLSEIITDMLEREVYERLLLKSSIIWDCESLADALNEACIRLGISDEDFAPSIHDQGNQIDVRLF